MTIMKENTFSIMIKFIKFLSLINTSEKINIYRNGVKKL